MISYVSSVWSATWSVHGQTRELCMISHVISAWYPPDSRLWFQGEQSLLSKLLRILLRRAQWFTLAISKIKNLERKRYNYLSELYSFSIRSMYRLLCGEVFYFTCRCCFTVWNLAQWQAHLILDVFSFRGKRSPSRWWSCWAASMTW